MLRQDPDTILIGELRDTETAHTALQAAESGHLVFSTMHTIDAAETVGRMIEFFPPGKQQQIRSVLAGVLRGVISQRLLPRHGGGRVAAVEVMVTNARIADLIREERTDEISDAVADGSFFEMQTFQQALIDHVLEGRVEREIAGNAASNMHDFFVALDHAVKVKHAASKETLAVAETVAEDVSPTLRVVTPGRGLMRSLLAAAALAVVLSLGAGSASADTFAVVPDVTTAPLVLPSAEIANDAGALLLPPGVFDAPFLPVAELSYEELHTLWLRAGAAYGIPWQVLAAINKIESNFGRNMGPSSAGAVGWMQFMPDTWLRWGMDGNGDGIADPWNPDDAVHAAARYLAAAEGRTDISRAIFAYNHAQWYVDDVLQLAALFGAGAGSDVVFTLDRMAIELEEAQLQVASLGEQLEAAEAHELELGARADLLSSESQELESLLSDRLVAERDAFEAGQEHAAATAEVDRLRLSSTQWQATLEAAQSGARAASFMPAAAGMLRMPTQADGYVFPVGGDPAQHHGRPSPPRLSGRRHRGSAGLAGLCAHRRGRALAGRRRPLRHRAHAPLVRRPRMDLLPSFLPRQRDPAGLRPECR